MCDSKSDPKIVLQDVSDRVGTLNRKFRREAKNRDSRCADAILTIGFESPELHLNSVSESTENRKRSLKFIKCHFVNYISLDVMPDISSLDIEDLVQASPTYVLIKQSEELYQPETFR